MIVIIKLTFFFHFRDAHMEKAASSKTPTLTKSSDMGDWVVGT